MPKRKLAILKGSFGPGDDPLNDAVVDSGLSLSVTLDSHGEELVSAHLRSGRYHSAEEVVTRALETLTEREPPQTQRKKTPAEAVADIRELLKGVTLGGLKIRDLINEGRKY